MSNCGNLVQPKQIFKIIACEVRANAFTTTVSTTDIVTTEITTVLGSAGQGGSSVPVQVSPNDNSQGIITTGVNNRVEIWDNTTCLKLQDGDGNEVYGRITEAAGVYTLSYYSKVSGVETAFQMDGRDIDFTINYRFTFEKFPGDCNLSISSRNVNDDPLGGLNGRCVCEEIAVTAQNDLDDLTYTPSDAGCVKWSVNHLSYCNGGSGPFSTVGKVASWNPATGQYNLETTDCVCVCYFTHDGT